MDLVERVTVLRTVELFAGVPGQILATLAAQANETTIDAGAVLMKRGDPGDSLFVVLDGALSARVGELLVAMHGPGSVVGELAVLVPEPRSATVRATTKTTLLEIDRAAVDELLLDYPEVAKSIIATLVRRFQALNEHLAESG
jgi:CRP-like cAMP-binding protein